MGNLRPVKDIIRTDAMKTLSDKELYTEDGRRLSPVHFYSGHLKELYYQEKESTICNDSDVKKYVPSNQRKCR